MQKVSAIIRVELGIDPDTLSDEEWAKYFNEWVYTQQIKSKLEAEVMETAVLKALAKAFGKNE